MKLFETLLGQKTPAPTGDRHDIVDRPNDGAADAEAPKETPEPPHSLSAAALEAKLWERIHDAAEELKSIFGSDPASEDAAEVLHLMVQSHRTIIQQPPAAAQAVLGLLNRRNYGQAELTRHIERDPALSQALLKHANSTYYASKHGKPVVAIKAAVQRIGASGVHATVMSQILRGQLSRPGADLDRMVTMTWDHMVGTAPIARSIARAFKADPETSFTLGLLHDVGKLVFFTELAALRKRRRRDALLSPLFVRAALDKLHEPVGGIAALQWGLDPSSAWVIAHHHRIDVPEAPDTLTELVHVAERADLAMRGVPIDVDEVWETAGITVEKERLVPMLQMCGALPEDLNGDAQGDSVSDDEGTLAEAS